MASKVLGLDIGTSMVRIAEVEMTSRSMDKTPLGTLTRYSEAPVPAGAVVEGEINDTKAVSSAIKHALSHGGFTTREAIVGVGNARTVVREMQVASMPMDQLRKSLPFQVEDSLPMHTDEALLDFYPTAEEDGQTGAVLRGIMVAVSKRSASACVLAAESGGIEVKGVDLRAFALQRALVPGQWMQGNVALADIGARTATIVIVDNGVPRLVRMLSGGGQEVTDAIASITQKTQIEAEDIKMRYGISSLNETGNQQLIDGVMAATKTVVDGIRNTVLYYTGNNAQAQFQHIVLTGGGAQLPGLGQYLASACRLPVSFGTATGALKVSKRVQKALAGRESLATMAVGLSMGEV